MEELAKKLINDHKHPLVKVDLPGSKLYLRSYTAKETESIENSQNILQNVFEHSRVERRCARAKAEWVPDQCLARVTKVVKSLLKYYGFQDKNGIFLYPEEMLYLLETNRLEVTLNSLPLSVQEVFEFVTSKDISNISLKRYRVYKKLTAMGYKVVRHVQYVKKKFKKTIENDKKAASFIPVVKIDEISPIPSKKRKLDNPDIDPNCNSVEKNIDSIAESSCSSSFTKESEYIKKIFTKMKDTAPKEYNAEVDANKRPDYYIFLPAHINNVTPDFNIFICEKELMERKQFGTTSKDIFAICSDDGVSFYRICEGNLPTSI